MKPTEQKNTLDFDVSLLEINLAMTVEQRVLSHDQALEVAHEFEKAGRDLYSVKSK